MSDTITTSLAQIKAHDPCADGYAKLVKTLGENYGDDTPISFKQIYDSNGYNNTLWALRSVDLKFYPLWRHFAVDCAEDVKHLMTDKRSLDALKVARRYADGKATDKELAAAWAAAQDAAYAALDAARRDAAYAARDAAQAGARDAARDAACAAWDATWDAAWTAAYAARDAAWTATCAAAARDAAQDAAYAAQCAASAAAWAAARDAAYAAQDAQITRLFKYCKTGKRVMK